VITLTGPFVITGTGTAVGKTVVTAALAALALTAGQRVAVLKPAQTGVTGDEPGDVDEVARLAGAAGTTCEVSHPTGATGAAPGTPISDTVTSAAGQLTTRELARYPDPLAPATAARRAGLPAVTPAQAAAAAAELAQDHDVVLIEGAGGLLVRFDNGGGTVADVARALGAPVLVVAAAGLGTLNATALTTEALRARGLRCAGVVIGSWPSEPDLACRCNLADLPVTSGNPLVGILPEGAARLGPDAFLKTARAGFVPALGGCLDVTRLIGRAG
jgi:dethiobiotin synthetase